MVGTIILPLLLLMSGAGVIGWAKPVPINPYYYRKPIWGEFLVAMAGPLSNIILGVIASIALVAFAAIAWESVYGVLQWQAQQLFATWLMMFATTNFVLAFFNLLPLPPLDGYRIIKLISPQAGRRMAQYQQYIGIGLMILIISPLGSWFGRVLWGAAYYTFSLLITIVTPLFF
jgi:Zn-dependent protease